MDRKRDHEWYPWRRDLLRQHTGDADPGRRQSPGAWQGRAGAERKLGKVLRRLCDGAVTDNRRKGKDPSPGQIIGRRALGSPWHVMQNAMRPYVLTAATSCSRKQ